MEIKLSMNDPKMFNIIINKNLVHVQVHFLKIEFIHIISSHNMNAFFTITVHRCQMSHNYDNNLIVRHNEIDSQSARRASLGRREHITGEVRSKNVFTYF